MKQLRLYQGYSSSQAKEFYDKLLHDMREYGELYIGEDIGKFIESPFDIIKTKALIILDHTNGQGKFDWNEFLNKLYSNWKNEFRCSILIFTNEHFSKTLKRDPKVEYRRK